MLLELTISMIFKDYMGVILYFSFIVNLVYGIIYYTNYKLRINDLEKEKFKKNPFHELELELGEDFSRKDSAIGVALGRLDALDEECSKKGTTLEEVVQEYIMKRNQKPIEEVKEIVVEKPNEEVVPQQTVSDICNSIHSLIINRNKQIAEDLRSGRGTALGNNLEKESLEYILYMLKGKLPTSTIGNDFQRQQQVAQKIWGLCSKMKQEKTTEWIDVQSGLRMEGDEDKTKGKDPIVKSKSPVVDGPGM